MTKTVVYFAHANGIASPCYQTFFDYFDADIELKYIPVIGLNPDYPVEPKWEKLVAQVIADIELQAPKQAVVGLGHSFGALVLLMASYQRPDLFRQLILMDPPFVIGKTAPIFELLQKLGSKKIDHLTPTGLSLKRKDAWSNREQAYQQLRGNALFKQFDERCFQDFIQHGLKEDEAGISLQIPKQVEADIFRTVPSWWWRWPRKAPNLPVHLITAEQSAFYKQGFPQGLKKIYGIEFSVVAGGHMFPLESPEQSARDVQQLIRSAL